MSLTMYEPPITITEVRTAVADCANALTESMQRLMIAVNTSYASTHRVTHLHRRLQALTVEEQKQREAITVAAEINQSAEQVAARLYIAFADSASFEVELLAMELPHVSPEDD